MQRRFAALAGARPAVPVACLYGIELFSVEIALLLPHGVKQIAALIAACDRITESACPQVMPVLHE